MTTSDPSPAPTTTGRWRQRVRALTAGVVGAAVLAAGGVTAALATDQDAAVGTTTSTASSGLVDPATGAGSTTGSGTGSATGTGSSGTTAAGDTSGSTGSTGSTGSLTAPTQVPGSSSGQSHTTSGGS